MKSKAVLIDGFWIAVDNGRNHSITLDLPTSQGGTDKGPTALELAVMGLAGCIVTILKLTCDKMRIPVEKLEAVVDAEKPKEALTVTKASIIAKIKTSADEALVKRAWKITLKNCPVGILFKQAGVEIEENLEIIK
ncbi:MAG: hypothetical protein DRJ37_05430 [Thermoprotei archaeon]|nr:MAG: hypothetical protein DRJ37_05430 [Thermoprotei archaeon]